jgi:hypothetical protein
MMDPTQNAAFVIFAALSPLLIAFVKQSGFSAQANALIAFGAYVVVGIAGALFSGLPLTIENAVTLVTTATIVGSAAYNLIWSNIGAAADGSGSLDERLTTATSLVK